MTFKYKYIVEKNLEIAGQHKLDLPYESKCRNSHGHNWVITIFVGSNTLTEYGMVLDFKHIKNEIEDKLDHQNLNEVFDFNPTAENIAEWIALTVNNMRKGIDCFRVIVRESSGNVAIYQSIGE